MKVGNIEVADGMTGRDCENIYERHGLSWQSDQWQIATVLGGLEAELAYMTNEAHTQTHEYAVKLIPLRVELMEAQTELTEAQEKVEALEVENHGLRNMLTGLHLRASTPQSVGWNDVTGEYQEAK
jgi:hypothetical protein